MAWRVKVAGVTSVLNANKPLPIPWIHSTTVAKLVRKMCELCCFSHAEGSSLRGISRISGLAYDTVVSIVQAAAEKAQMLHNASHQNVDTDAIAADELWSFALKKQSRCLPEELEAGDCTDSIESSKG